MSKKSKYILENVTIEDFAAEGKCILRNEGEVIFVEGSNVCPGDRVQLLVKKSKKRFAEGRILKTISYSKDRIEPFCEHFGVCGGCKWQHIPYETQIKQKQQQVLDQLSRLGKVDISTAKPILGSTNTQFYRNKLEFTFSNSRWFTETESRDDTNKNALGFHIPKRFEKVLPINKCYLQGDPSNQILGFFQLEAEKSGLPFYDHIEHTGFFRTVMIRVVSTGEIMVLVQFAQDDVKAIHIILDKLLLEIPNIHSLNYTINTKRNDTFNDLEIINYKGKPYIVETMEGMEFRIGVKSFYQTNSIQAYELYKIVRELADIQANEIVYDLYTGTGTIANFVAKQAKKVVGIEYVEDAIVDAKVNSEVNGITNTSFFSGDMAKIFTEDFVAINGKPDVIITDPPRAGMDDSVVEVLLKLEASKIIYVSCNAATQARDLSKLNTKYEIFNIQPVDMFPHTFHVENVVGLRLKS
ncbi:MAG: 23S rRNA (uracil(1939)-C(5))-methyltransferase RlmD [Leadbetterella sp.]